MMTDFEFDPDKSAVNKDKHGIDFIEAQAIWDDENILIVEGTILVEARLLAFGMIDGKLWTAVHVMRGTNTRLISVRRARENERDDYDRDQNERKKVDHG